MAAKSAAHYLARYLPVTCQAQGMKLPGTCQVLVKYLSGSGHEIDKYLPCTFLVLARYLTNLGQARWMLCNCQAGWSAGKADQELAGWWQNLNLSFDRWSPAKG